MRTMLTEKIEECWAAAEYKDTVQQSVVPAADESGRFTSLCHGPICSALVVDSSQLCSWSCCVFLFCVRNWSIEAQKKKAREKIVSRQSSPTITNRTRGEEQQQQDGCAFRHPLIPRIVDRCRRANWDDDWSRDGWSRRHSLARTNGSRAASFFFSGYSLYSWCLHPRFFCFARRRWLESNPWSAISSTLFAWYRCMQSACHRISITPIDASFPSLPFFLYRCTHKKMISFSWLSFYRRFLIWPLTSQGTGV